MDLIFRGYVTETGDQLVSVYKSVDTVRFKISGSGKLFVMSLCASLDELTPEVFNFSRPIFGLSYRNFVYLISGWKRHGKNHYLFESSNRF